MPYAKDNSPELEREALEISHFSRKSGETDKVFNDPEEEYAELLLASVPGELG